MTAWRTHRLPNVAAGLQYACHVTGWLRGVLPRELLVAGVRATNWGDVAGPLVAEHALLLTLGALRAMPRWNGYLSEGTDVYADLNALTTRSLRGRRVAIHGLGRIARELIKLLRPFEVDITAFSADVPAFVYEHNGGRPPRRRLGGARRVERRLHHLRGADRSDARLARPRRPVSTPAGGGVRQRRARRDRRRGGVDEGRDRAQLRLACNVFAVEPLPLNSALRAVPDALFSPHIAGPTYDWYPRCGTAAIENVRRYLAGESLRDEVTLELYDRAT